MTILSYIKAKTKNTSNKVAIIYLYKNLYNFLSSYKCYKKEIKYLKYWNLAKQDYININTVEEIINVAIISRNKNKKDSF